MPEDLESLLRVTTYIIVSATYARSVAGATAAGKVRLLVLLPVIITFSLLPLSFHSIHLRCISSFFLTWLGTFKLILLAFDSGPLSPSLPLSIFIATSSLPVKIRPGNTRKPKPAKILFPVFVKAVLLCFLLQLYHRRSSYNRYVLLSIYCLHVYLALEIVLASAAFLAVSLLGLDLENQFDSPYKSNSLQDFWGRRWNLMVTNILRPSVYFPIKSRFGTNAAFFAVFLVSGLMHELVFYYITLEWPPTWEVTWFFVLHGICTGLEVMAKKKWGWIKVPEVFRVTATLGFVAGTGIWLFFPPLTRGDSDEKTIEECLVAIGFVKERIWGFVDWILPLVDYLLYHVRL